MIEGILLEGDIISQYLILLKNLGICEKENFVQLFEYEMLVIPRFVWCILIETIGIYMLMNTMVIPFVMLHVLVGKQIPNVE